MTTYMESLANFHQESRPWGNFIRFTKNEQSTVKLINVTAGELFSLQRHIARAEFWYVISGSGTITAGNEKIDAHVGTSVTINKHIEHRAEAGPLGLGILEIAFGTFDEKDIERLDDKYGRQ
jgi:mannose-6-phosphate isomerase-like protein (cupin superfamily)